MKFKRKPITIEAIQWTGANVDEILAFILATGAARRDLSDRNAIVITTIKGEMRASKNDWIIRGAKGEYYSCKPDIFTATYERVINE